MKSPDDQTELTQVWLENDDHFRIPRKPINKDSIPQPVAVSSSYTYSALKGIRQDANSQHLQRSRRFLNDWWLEVLCCLLAVSALLAIVGIIYPYQHKELPQWPYSISINTLIAIFTAILKSSMLLVIAEGLSHLKWTWLEKSRPLQDLSRYDGASRGPLGALKLLISLRGRGLVASVGALLTLLSLAIDPTAQQVVRYYPCTITSLVANASISRTNMYSRLDGRINAGAGVIPAGAKSSINAGIFSPGSVKVDFECATGDCLFPEPYHSVGFYSNCTDVTELLFITNNTVLIPSSDNQTYYGDLLTYSLPSGTSLYAADARNLTNFVIAPDQTNFTGYSYLAFDIITIPGLVNGASSVSPCESNNVTFGCNGIGAAVCELRPCVKTYSGSIKDGSLIEKLNDTLHPIIYDSFATIVDVSCLSEPDCKTILDAGYDIPANENWFKCNLSQNEEIFGARSGDWFLYQNDPHAFTNTNKTISADCVYSVPNYQTSSLNYWFASFLNGSSAMVGSDDSAVGPSVVEAVKYAIDNSDNDWYASPTFESVQNVFNNITESLTAYMRSNGDANASQPAMGYVNRDTTCVHIRWAWLTFPAILSTLTLIFFVTMLHETHRSGDARDWKSSPLPMLFHGFDKDAVESPKPTALKQVKGMEEYARGLRVRLVPTVNGWVIKPEHEI